MRKITKEQLAFLTGGLLIYSLFTAFGGKDTVPELKRNLPGEGEASYVLFVEGIGEETVRLEIPVMERQYSEEESQRIFEELKKQLPGMILGENPSLEQVNRDLKLLSSDGRYGVEMKWESSEPELIDRFGQVDLQQIKAPKTMVILTAHMSLGIWEDVLELEVTAVPAVITEEEKQAERFLEAVKKEDKKQAGTDYLKLPEVYEGQPIRYDDGQKGGYEIFLIMGVLLAAAYPAMKKAEEQRLEKQRERLLLLDYSEIVSKLMIFIGAGMAISRAWERIVLDYEDSLKEGKTGRDRPAYEEMCHTYYQIKSGMPEGKAYYEFGKRCGIPPYMKLGALLEQNRREGTKKLKSLLNLEMIDAFEQRKNLARKMGEEAGTKLLFPLFLMLGTVMVMIMVPAFLSFY